MDDIHIIYNEQWETNKKEWRLRLRYMGVQSNWYK